MGDAFVTKEALILRHNDKSEQVSYEWTINSNKLVLETKDISTDSYLRYTFKKVSSEVKESETLNIIK
jgi:hypothetical protein